MSVVVFSAAGFVFAVNSNGVVMQLTAVEAIILSAYLKSVAAEAMIELVLTYNETYLLLADYLQDLAEAYEDAALESVFG